MNWISNEKNTRFRFKIYSDILSDSGKLRQSQWPPLPLSDLRQFLLHHQSLRPNLWSVFIFAEVIKYGSAIDETGLAYTSFLFETIGAMTKLKQDLRCYTYYVFLHSKNDTASAKSESISRAYVYMHNIHILIAVINLINVIFKLFACFARSIIPLIIYLMWIHLIIQW